MIRLSESAEPSRLEVPNLQDVSQELSGAALSLHSVTNLNELSNLNDATGLEKLSNGDEESEGNDHLSQSQRRPVPMVDRNQSMQVIMEESDVADTTFDQQEQSEQQSLSAGQMKEAAKENANKTVLSATSSQVNHLINFFDKGDPNKTKIATANEPIEEGEERDEAEALFESNLRRFDGSSSARKSARSIHRKPTKS